MGRIYLIRHARPASSWGQDGDPDPGLDATGKVQAEQAAEALLSLPNPPRRVVSSPLRRCRETAEPFARAIGAEVEVDPLVGEIPTPSLLAEAERGPWLRQAFAGRWDAIEGDLDYEAWRRSVADAVARRQDTAVFSHFVAINAVASLLAGRPEVLHFRPDHASTTVLDLVDGQLRLVQLGRDAETGVL